MEGTVVIIRGGSHVGVLDYLGVDLHSGGAYL